MLAQCCMYRIVMGVRSVAIYLIYVRVKTLMWIQVYRFNINPITQKQYNDCFHD